MIVEVRARRGCEQDENILPAPAAVKAQTDEAEVPKGARGDLIYLVINGNRETNQHTLPAESSALWFSSC